ncbi:MAG: PEP-CTERM sorting domain-containing protein [Methylococcales bacterium]
MTCNLAQAGIVDLTLFGETESASEINDFGLSIGDQVSLKATFDYSILTGMGNESISFSGDSGNTLSFFMGDLIFAADNFANFSLGYPTINFIDGIFSGIDYFAFSGVNGAPENLFSYGNTWASISTGNSNSQLLSAQGSDKWVTGIWDVATLEISNTPDIPEPGPLALAGIGLLGAWIASRRKKTLT